ncbi:MAG TPA: potassium channel family protein [Vicinamibacterales bacterium]|nr:potassium channel family protein [Vicinamibacterales bacterium]
MVISVHLLAFLLSGFVMAIVLWDAFETVILPRTVSRRLRLTRLYFRFTWRQWRWVAANCRTDRLRERFLAIFGPMSLLGLAAVWALGLVVGFAGLQWSAGSNLRPLHAAAPFIDDLYLSGTTFFTLGLGDVQPVGRISRLITVAEAGTGFAFLAIVIAYFPVLYQAFSRREARLTLLDAWAGSPPAAVEVLRRLAARNQLDALPSFLKDWEYWCSELLESHISYPTVAFFRSQHTRQSWVSALATILDLSALVEVGLEGVPTWQAHVTFAIARHAAVDLSQVLHAEPDLTADRLPIGELEELRHQIENAGLTPVRSAEADRRLSELRRSYEPYVNGLAHALMMPAPPWWHRQPVRDNWQVSPKGVSEAHF